MPIFYNGKTKLIYIIFETMDF